MFRPALACLAFALLASPAFAQGAAPADMKAVSDCLDKAGKTGQFGGACVGIIADPCAKTASTKKSHVEDSRKCAARELAVWTALKEIAAKRVRAGHFEEITAALTESEKGWTQLRDKLCPVFDKVEPGSLPGDAAYCRMQTTAHRTLLLQKLGDAVNER